MSKFEWGEKVWVRDNFDDDWLEGFFVNYDDVYETFWVTTKQDLDTLEYTFCMSDKEYDVFVVATPSKIGGFVHVDKDDNIIDLEKHASEKLLHIMDATQLSSSMRNVNIRLGEIEKKLGEQKRNTKSVEKKLSELDKIVQSHRGVILKCKS